MKKKVIVSQDILMEINHYRFEYILVTDFCFSLHSRRWNTDMFVYMFSMCNNSATIALDAALNGYNDNLN